MYQRWERVSGRTIGPRELKEEQEVAFDHLYPLEVIDSPRVMGHEMVCARPGALV